MRLVATLVAAVLLLAGCSGSDSAGEAQPSAAASTSSAPTTAAPSPEVTRQSGTVVGIVIADGKVLPQGERVEATVGAKVTLDIRSDVDEEIHVHSDPEHTYEVKAGQPVTESFTVETPGQVAVEAHELGVTIVQLVVRP